MHIHRLYSSSLHAGSLLSGAGLQIPGLQLFCVVICIFSWFMPYIAALLSMVFFSSSKYRQIFCFFYLAILNFIKGETNIFNC